MLTICILTKNSQDELSKLLPTLQFANQVVIIDDFSSDNTESIARAHKCNYYKRALDNDFSAQRNYGLKMSRDGWVLFIDPDEQISDELSQEIQKSIEGTAYDGFFIKREDLFLGKILKHGETGSVWLLRLAKKGKGFWGRPVHEVWQVGNTGKLQEVLFHQSHQNIGHFLKKINYYTSIEAAYRKKSGKKTTVFEAISYPCGKFINNYFVKRGFLDGMEGFIMALMMSVHSFLVRAKQLT